MNDKTPYQVNIRANDGYLLGEYYLKLTKEEVDVIYWFTEATRTDENINLINLKNEIFTERN